MVTYSSQCLANPIAINFEGAFVPSGGVQSLPIYVDNNEPSPATRILADPGAGAGGNRSHCRGHRTCPQ